MHPLSSSQTEIAINTSGRGFTDISPQVESWLQSINASGGLLTAFIRHTSASLVIQENADPDVLRDLEDALARMAPEGHPYRHCSEGPDDMPAHIKSLLTATSLSIPVINGQTALGTWQGLFLIEHRSRPHVRKVILQFMGS